MSSYRYWRLECSANPSSGYFSFAELALRSTVGGSNFASSANTSSSSQFVGQYPRSAAFDGSRGTFWLSDLSPTPHWFQCDAGSPVPLAEIAIGTRTDGFFASTLPPSILVRGSNDGVTFVLVHTITQATWAPNSQFRFFLPGFAPTYDLTPRRFWRLELVSSGAVSLCNEYQLRLTPGGANIINTGTLTASSSFDGTRLPANTQDGSDATRWNSLNPVAHPQWLRVDFGIGNARVIREFLFKTINTDWSATIGLPLQLTMSVSDDDVVYTPVAHFERVLANWAQNTAYQFTVGAPLVATGPARVTRTSGMILVAEDSDAGAARVSKTTAHALVLDIPVRGDLRTTRSAAGLLAQESSEAGVVQVTRSAAHILLIDDPLPSAIVTRNAAEALVQEDSEAGAARVNRLAVQVLGEEFFAPGPARVTRLAALALVSDRGGPPGEGSARARVTRTAAMALLGPDVPATFRACAVRPVSTFIPCEVRP
jgi:hypothetical protein